MQTLHRWTLLAVVSIVWISSLMSPEPSSAQTPAPRLREAIAEANRIPLPGSRSPRALLADDVGTLSPETPIPGITLVFKRSAEQDAALQTLLTAQQDPASPLYHQWLTPDIFAARFGMASEDLAKVQAWLQAYGFLIDDVPHSRDRITFSGTALQVQAAFGTELHHFNAEGESHFAPASDLALPAALAQITADVLHLSDFRPKPSVRAQSSPQPQFTSFSSQTHYLTPLDIQKMYDADFLTNAGNVSSNQQLAVVGQSYIDTVAFNGGVANFGYQLGPRTITSILVPNSGVEATSPGNQAESELDVEYAASPPRISNVLFVYVGANQNYDVFDALDFAITENVAPVVSISYGICESLVTPNYLTQSNALFAQAAAQGQTLIASSGDDGGTACAPYTSAGISSAQQQALIVGFPADSPFVTAVGGVQMAPGTFTAGASPYWAPSVSYDNTYSLLSYVPEVVWNEGSATAGILASGGGISAFYARPSWQTGVPGIPAGNYRLVPDVALQASTASPGFLFCTSDPLFLAAEGETTSCSAGLSDGKGRYTAGGGTSFAAPLFANFVAILNESQHTTGMGNINPVLYSLASNPVTYTTAFHDITSGTTACVAGASNCAAPDQSGYAAGPGYDLATGLGSVDLEKLASVLPATKSSSLTPTATTIIASSLTAAPGATLSVQISVGSTAYTPPNTPVPTGTVSLSLDGAVVSTALPLSPSTAISKAALSSIVAPAAVGSHILTSIYSGDQAYAPSRITYSIAVGTLTATGGFSLAAPGLTVANNGTGSTPVTLTPSGGYSGRVLWSLSYVAASSTSTPLSACYLIPPLSTPNSTSSKLTLGTGTACNSPLTAALRDPAAKYPKAGHHDVPTVQQAHTHGPQTTVAYTAALLCTLIFSWRRKLRFPLLAVFVLSLVPLTGLTGCGGQNSNTTTTTTTTPPTPTPTPASYTITLTGKDSVTTAISASTTFTLTVN